jgi:hypothetical protein
MKIPVPFIVGRDTHACQKMEIAICRIAEC